MWCCALAALVAVEVVGASLVVVAVGASPSPHSSWVDWRNRGLLGPVPVAGGGARRREGGGDREEGGGARRREGGGDRERREGEGRC